MVEINSLMPKNYTIINTIKGKQSTYFACFAYIISGCEFHHCISNE